jgi:hypothetical protein
LLRSDACNCLNPASIALLFILPAGAKTMLRPLLFVVTVAVAICCRADEPAQLTAQAKAMIEKSLSFDMQRFPIGFWNYQNLSKPEVRQHMAEADVETWSDAGFTVPQSPSFDPTNAEHVAHMRHMLDWAQARKMKLILCDPRATCPTMNGGNAPSPPDGYAAGVRNAISQFGDHPALFGFYVGDEPDAAMKERLFACSRIQKELAPKLHPYANLLPYLRGIEKRAGTDSWPNYLDEYVKKSNADLISYDCYEHMNPGRKGWEDYFANLRLYREAALRNGVPFWNTILSVGIFRYRSPNYDEFRWQFNTTIASGAHGVMWYVCHMGAPVANHRQAPIDEFWERTSTYYDLRRVQQSFHRRYGDLFNRLASTRVTFTPKAMGGGEVFTPNGLVSKLETDAPDHPLLLGEFVDREGRRYLMLVNCSMTESVLATITIPGQDARISSWDWHGAKQEGLAYSAMDCNRSKAGARINHWLAPGQEAVYCVE